MGILEVERPFYSNRKLVANRLPSRADDNGMRDEVLLHTMAVTYSGVTEQSITSGANTERITVGPCVLTKRFPTISPNRENDIIMDMGELLCFEERTFDVTTTAGANLTYGEIQNITVLEALGTQAGF